MGTRHFGRSSATLRWLVMAGFAVLAVAPAAAQDRVREHFTATLAVPASAPGQPTTAPVHIYIYGYSTDQEVQNLAKILADKGPDALQEALFDLEKGWIRIGNSLGYPIAVARSKPTEQGRRIILVADRPIDFLEAWHGARSLDYPFAYLELRLGKDGKGEGDMIPAAKIRMSGSAIDVENYSFQPGKLLGVSVR